MMVADERRIVVEVDPWRCRMWDLHDRSEDLLDANACRDVIRSMSANGQVLPALGRRVKEAPGIDAELIYGARRLFAARHLETMLMVEMVDVNDDDALRLMYIENAHRKDISPYERGIAFKRWLRQGRFATQTDLAEAVGTSVATVSRLLSFAALPAAVVSAFVDPREIREEWAIQLARACDEPDMRSHIARTARRLVSDNGGGRPASWIFRRLMSAGKGEVKQRTRDRVVFDRSESQPIFRVRETHRSTSFVVPSHMLTRGKLEEVVDAVQTVLSTN